MVPCPTMSNLSVILTEAAESIGTAILRRLRKSGHCGCLAMWSSGVPSRFPKTPDRVSSRCTLVSGPLAGKGTVATTNGCCPTTALRIAACCWAPCE
jgi:hypothetical protein